MSDLTERLRATDKRVRHSQELRDEAADKIDWLKEQLDSLANFNPDWDILQATQESLREHMATIKSLTAEVRVLRDHMRTCDVDAADIELGNLTFVSDSQKS